MSAKKNVVTIATDAIADLRSKVAAMFAANPEIAAAIAAQSVVASGTRKARVAATATETEAERACRCAQFVSGNRSKLLVALIDALGDKASVSVTEAELHDATGLPSYRIRPDLVTVCDRLNDTGNDKFPLVSQIGYSLRIEGERSTPRVAHFARNVAVVRKARASKSKAVATVAAAQNEGESNA